METKEVFSRNDLFTQKMQQETKQSRKPNSIPYFALISNFNFFQLFLIGAENQIFSNRLLAQQTTEKYTKQNLDKEDINFNFNNFINNQSITSKKDLFNHLLEVLIDLQKLNKKKESNSEKKQEQEQEENNDIYKKEDEFYDRKNFIKEINNHQKYIAFQSEIKFIELKSLEPDQIKEKLMNSEDFYYKPILFYTLEDVSSSLDFPIKVLMKRNLKLNDNVLKRIKEKKGLKCQDSELGNVINEMVAKKSKRYFQLSFIIGAKNGVPTLILFDGSKMIKIYDGKSEPIEEDEDLTYSLDLIYMLYYSPEGFTSSIQLKNISSNRSKIMHGQISESDGILKEFINYKLMNSWKDKEFNFIELIRESVIYPSFFGFCSGLNLDTSFYGSVTLGTDKSSESSIINNFEAEQQQQIRKFVLTYGTFTAFVLTLPKFLDSLESKNYDSADTFVKYLFGSVPAHNVYLFDLFVDFIKTIIDSDDFSNNSNFKKNLKQYLYITVSNREKLNLGDVDFKSQTFNRLFNLSQRQGEYATPIKAVSMLDDIWNRNSDESNSKNIFSKLFKETVTIRVEESSLVRDANGKDKANGNTHLVNNPKYIKDKTYTDYLDKAFIYPEIHL